MISSAAAIELYTDYRIFKNLGGTGIEEYVSHYYNYRRKKTIGIDADHKIINSQFSERYQNLKKLYLTGITKDNVTSLFRKVGRLHDLEYLSVSGYHMLSFTNRPIEDIPINLLSGCSQLRNLDIHKAQLSSTSGIEKFPNLDTLNISDCNLTSIDGIEHCKNITYLSLRSWKLKNIDQIGECKNLKGIELRGCKNIQSLKILNSLPNLIHINITDCDKNVLKEIPHQI